MGVTDFFAGEIATELLKVLILICRKSCLCKPTAENLIASLNHLLPIIQEIKYSGVELPAPRQRQLDDLSITLTSGLTLASKVLNSSRWNVYKNLQLARKMEKLEKTVSRFMAFMIPAHVLADVHHVRFDMVERFDKLDNSTRSLEKRLGDMKIGVEEGGGWLGEAVRRMEVEVEEEGSLGSLGVGMEVAKREVKEMVIGRGEEVKVLGICGIGGSGKTTLAREIRRDNEVQSKLFLSSSFSVKLFIKQLEANGSTGHGSFTNKLSSSRVLSKKSFAHSERFWQLSSFIEAFNTNYKLSTSILNELS